jgi:hypothetical protein
MNKGFSVNSQLIPSAEDKKGQGLGVPGKPAGKVLHYGQELLIFFGIPNKRVFGAGDFSIGHLDIKNKGIQGLKRPGRMRSHGHSMSPFPGRFIEIAFEVQQIPLGFWVINNGGIDHDDIVREGLRYLGESRSLCGPL